MGRQSLIAANRTSCSLAMDPFYWHWSVGVIIPSDSLASSTLGCSVFIPRLAYDYFFVSLTLFLGCTMCRSCRRLPKWGGFHVYTSCDFTYGIFIHFVHFILCLTHVHIIRALLHHCYHIDIQHLYVQMATYCVSCTSCFEILHFQRYT